jgi:DNA-binding response OmpR family regulator
MATSILQAERYEDRLPIDVFVVSPNSRLQQDLQEKLRPPRWNVFQAISGAGALELLRRHGAEDGVLLLDPQLPDLEPNGFNAIIRDRFPHTQVMMLNSHTGQLLMT